VSVRPCACGSVCCEVTAPAFRGLWVVVLLLLRPSRSRSCGSPVTPASDESRWWEPTARLGIRSNHNTVVYQYQKIKIKPL